MIDNSLAPSEIRTLIATHAIMLATFAQRVTAGALPAAAKEALLDTVARLHCLIEVYPVEEPKAEEPKCGTVTDWPADGSATA